MRCAPPPGSNSSSPVGFEAVDDLGDFVGAGGDDGVVARHREVLLGPVQRLDERVVVVDHHGLLVRQIKGRVAGPDLDAEPLQRLPRGVVVGFPVATLGVEHDLDIHAAPVGGNHRLQQRRVVEGEHLDPHRPGGRGDRVEHRLRRVVGQDDQRTRHVVSSSYWMRCNSAYLPPAARSSVCDPSSTTRPSSSTTILSASRMVLRR